MERASPLELQRPEAAIVNFYKESTTMGGHRDDAEPSEKYPIVSVSLGCAAIFLVSVADDGGRDDTPVAILLRSGDAVVMGGSSRRTTHGVAAILPRTPPPALQEALARVDEGRGKVEETEDVEEVEGREGVEVFEHVSVVEGVEQREAGNEAEARAFVDFVAVRRINLNVRQVFDS
jgi:hypothetical protein